MEFSQAQQIINYYNSKDNCLAVNLVDENDMTARLTLGDQPMLLVFGERSATYLNMADIEREIKKMIQDGRSPITSILSSIRGGTDPVVESAPSQSSEEE